MDFNRTSSLTISTFGEKIYYISKINEYFAKIISYSVKLVQSTLGLCVVLYNFNNFDF